MSAAESTTALLHLSAVITVLSLAYLGLDKAELSSNEAKDTLEETQKEAAEIMGRFSLTDGDFKDLGNKSFLKARATLFPACIVCLIAGVTPELRDDDKNAFFRYSLTRIPLIRVFKQHRHTYCMMFFAALSSLIFICTALSQIWGYVCKTISPGGFTILSQSGYEKSSSVILVLAFIVTVITAGAAQALRPKRVRRILAEMKALLEAGFEAELVESEALTEKLRATVQANQH